VDDKALRDKMVREQLIARGISDRRALDAFRMVSRHKFVPPDFQNNAYEDHPLPIGEEQTISQPYMVALMTQCLGLKGDEKVLEIGTGSGYQAAILACLAKKVYSMERFAGLAGSAAAILEELGYRNVEMVTGDGTLGWKEHAPYDGIIVTAAAPKIPDAYISQLNGGGKLVIPVGGSFSQILTVAEKRPEGVSTTEVCGCVFVPLVGKEGWKE